MPCTDGGAPYRHNSDSKESDIREIERLSKKLDLVTRLLCDLCASVENSFVFPVELQNWWDDHRINDLQRIKREMWEKLNPEERAVLVKAGLFPDQPYGVKTPETSGKLGVFEDVRLTANEIRERREAKAKEPIRLEEKKPWIQLTPKNIKNPTPEIQAQLDVIKGEPLIPEVNCRGEVGKKTLKAAQEYYASCIGSGMSDKELREWRDLVLRKPCSEEVIGKVAALNRILGREWNDYSA